MNWRFVAFLLVYFSLHAVLDALLLLILPYTFIFDRVARRLTFRIFWTYNKIVSRLFWSWDVSGVPFDSCPFPCLFIINHQTNWDHVFCHLFSEHRPRTFMKKALLWSPVGITIRLLDQLFLAKGEREFNEKMLDRAVWLLQNGVDVQIFPEGTRRWLQREVTPDPNELGHFHDGAFRVALRARVPVVPVVLEMRHLLSDPLFAAWPGTCRVHVCEPIMPEDLGDSVPDLRDRVKAIMTAALPLITQDFDSKKIR